MTHLQVFTGDFYIEQKIKLNSNHQSKAYENHQQ